MRLPRTVLALLVAAAYLAGTPAALPSPASSALRSPLAVAACGTVTDKMEPWRAGELRGANLFQGRWGGSSGPYPGRAVGSPLTQTDLDGLRALGANYVQLSVAGTRGEQAPYAPDPDVVAVIDDVVAKAARAGLFVVIAFRSGPGRNEQAIGRLTNTAVYGPILEDFWTSGPAQDAWLEMLRDAAARWGADPAVIGIDPMVEPNDDARRGFLAPATFFARYGGTLEDINRFNARAVAAVREVSDVPVLVEGDGYASPPFLPWLAVTGDPRSVYTTHDYEPAAFTQQAAGAGVTDHGSLADHERVLAPLRALAQRGVPVAVTEFGVRRYAPGAAAWLADSLSAYADMHASHALWEYVVAAQRPLYNDFDPEGGPDAGVRAVVPNAVREVVVADLARNCVRPAPAPTPAVGAPAPPDAAGDVPRNADPAAAPPPSPAPVWALTDLGGLVVAAAAALWAGWCGRRRWSRRP